MKIFWDILSGLKNMLLSGIIVLIEKIKNAISNNPE